MSLTGCGSMSYVDATCSDNFSLRLFLVKMLSGGVSIRHATKRDIVKDSLVVRGRTVRVAGRFYPCS